MLQGLIMGLIGTLIAHIKFKKMLNECLVEENLENVTLFEYKGKTYDRKKFIKLKALSLYEADIKKKDLEKQLAELESDLVKSKTPDLDSAIIRAYKLVIEKM